MANQRWSTDKNIQLINEYQRQECLWDPKHLQYKNRDARDAAYKIIMEAMEMQNVKEVVGKIRSLRNTYNNESLKTKKSNTTGMATNDLYISKIPWLSHLDFLKNIDSYTRENTENVVSIIYSTILQWMFRFCLFAFKKSFALAILHSHVQQSSPYNLVL